MAKELEFMDYSPAWKTEYEFEARAIKRVLGKNCIAIHHIGGTSFGEIKSKPIIDLMAIVSDMNLIDSLYDELRAIGYNCKDGEDSRDSRIFVKMVGKPHYNLHIFSADNKKEIERRVAVREYFIKNPDSAKEYEALKIKLAEKYGYDSNEYQKGKEEFLQLVEKHALNKKDKQDRLSFGMAVGMMIGLVLGFSIGVSIDNLVNGLCYGLGIGLVLGLTISSFDRSK